MCKKINLMLFKKGQVWMLKGENWTPEDRDMGITVGDRPVIVYSNVTTSSDFVTVIPCSSTTEFKNGVILNLEEDKKGIALVHEIRPVPAHKLNIFLGCIDDYTVNIIDDAVAVYLGLKHDITIEQRFFAFGKNRRKNFHDGYPTPIIQSDVNIEVDSDEHSDTKESTNDKLVITKKPDPVKKPKNNSTTKSPKKRKTVNGRRSIFDIEKLSDEEKKFILTAKVKDIASKYDIATSTVFRYRNMLKEESHQQNKNVEKKPSPPKIISTNKYRNKVYTRFSTKQIAKLTLDEKRLFSNLDSCKLSTAMNIPVETICIAQASFRDELGIDK